jgi:hypothetical protein
MTLADVRRVAVPTACAMAVEAHLRQVGRAGSEGLALWVGRQEGDLFRVFETVIPRQIHHNTADGVCVIVEGDALHRLNVRLFRERLTLLGQIHSHPGRAYHSSTDDAFAIATTVGCLSLVVPDFARAPFAISRCATYRLDAAARWRQVSPRDAAAMIVVGG